MKTLTYLPTLLALTIQVMVSGQTQDNQAHKIRIDIMGPKEPVKMNYTNSNITISMAEYTQLLEQVNSLKINAKKLRDEATVVEIQSLCKQIQASEFSEKISLQTFETNRGIILDLFTKVPKNNISYTKAQSSYSESERFMKLAKEMREEANAQLTMQAKYGDMTNAEEKETLALSKQEETLNLLKGKISQLTKHVVFADVSNQAISSSFENLLVLATRQAHDIKITAQQLRLSALNTGPNQKMILQDEAAALENDYLAKQLEISALKSKVDYSRFNENRKAIALLMEQVTNENIRNKAADINAEAERLMKIGKEMREEANAQLTLTAKIGAMSNAQENELFAMGKQQESLQMLDKGSLKAVVASR
ncbi:MAG: hypothetical protein V4580_08875 [Bacteroidota bacterium]